MKNNENLRKRALSGLIWKFAEKIGMQVVQLIIQIVLARLLLPEDYGIIGLLSIFICISDVFIQQGFTTGLIQKKDADDLDFSSVFYANIIMSLVIYVILFFSAPYVALFYNEPRLTLIMRVLSINVLIGAISAVHNAILTKSLDFKKSFFRGIANIVTQGIVGVVFAIWGYGPWALVFSKLAGGIIGSMILCFTVSWKPQKMFSTKRVKALFSYSSKVLGTNILNTLFNNIHSLVIGKFFSSAELGYYQRGQQLPQTFMMAIDGSMSEVLYPTLSLVQNDKIKLKNTLRRSMKLSVYVVLPLLMGLLATAKPLTIILLTDKWLSSVPYMRLACIVCAFWPFAARNQALNAIGKSSITFKLSLITKSLTLFFIIVCIPFGIYSIMIGTIITSIITMWLTSYYVEKYIGYTIKEFIKDIVPAILLSIIMAVLVSMIALVKFNNYQQLIIQIFSGIIIYMGGSFFMKIDSFLYILQIIKETINKKF